MVTSNSLRLVDREAGTVALRDRNDDELMLLCKAGHIAAFEVLARRHQAKVFGYAAKFLGDRNLADDACQSVFITLWRQRDRYKCEAKFGGYLAKLTLNACRYLVRSGTRRGAATDRYAASGAQETETGPEAEERLLRAESEKEMERRLSELPAKLKSALILRFYNELSYAEMSECLGISEATLRSRVYHGLKRLRTTQGT